MKPILLIALATSISAITACTLQRSQNPSAPTPAMAKASGSPLADLGQGHSIFMRQCSQCHETRIPNAIPTAEWHKIVPGMAWNAGLSKEEERLVTAYVVAASKVKVASQ